MASTKCLVVDHVIDELGPRAISYRLLLSDGQHRVSVTSRAHGWPLLVAKQCVCVSYLHQIRVCHNVSVSKQSY